MSKKIILKSNNFIKIIITYKKKMQNYCLQEMVRFFSPNNSTNNNSFNLLKDLENIFNKGKLTHNQFIESTSL